MSIDWKVERLKRNSFVINVPLKRNAEWEFTVLLTGDRHWDNPKSNHELQIEHLEEAKKRGAVVIDVGDFFCLMQGKYDKRANKSALRAEHQVDHYLDAVVDTATEFFAPYSKHFAFIATGNHEQAIENRHETNMIDRFVGAINNRTGSRISNGGFSGFVVFRFRWNITGRSPGIYRTVLHYDHGHGGGAIMSKDLLSTSRRAIFIPDADIICHSHTHDQWVVEFARKRINLDGAIYQDIQTHIKVGTYKDGYSDGYASWEATKGMPPKPIGAWWLRFFWSRKHDKVLHEVTRAQ